MTARKWPFADKMFRPCSHMIFVLHGNEARRRHKQSVIMVNKDSLSCGRFHPLDDTIEHDSCRNMSLVAGKSVFVFFD